MEIVTEIEAAVILCYSYYLGELFVPISQYKELCEEFDSTSVYAAIRKYQHESLYWDLDWTGEWTEPFPEPMNDNSEFLISSIS